MAPHWSADYVGRPYAEANCAQLAAVVYREQFGGQPVLPDDPPNLGRRCELMHDLLGDYAYPVKTPREGDLVLMVCRGRLSHVGVYCELPNSRHGYVLHALKNIGHVWLHRLGDLARINLTVEGFYRWKA